MGFWNRLKKMVAGNEPDRGLYFYVQLYQRPHQPSPEDEIVQIRISIR